MDANRKLREHFTELKRLGYIISLLGWDQRTYMPEGAVNSRAEQIALISGIVHQKLISKKTATIIKNAEKSSNIDSAMLREAKRTYNKSKKLPPKLVREITKTASLSCEAWEKAKIKFPALKGGVFRSWLNEIGLCFYYPVSEYI